MMVKVVVKVILSYLRVLVTDGRKDICECRVTSATDKHKNGFTKRTQG